MQLKGPLASVSRKDLNASVRALLPKLKEKGLEPSIEYLKHNIKYSKYIPYTKYKSGLCAHAGHVSARRPIKCYLYLLNFLKGLRGSLGEKKVDQIIINQSTYLNPKGTRKGGRGRQSREDSRLYRAIILTK